MTVVQKSRPSRARDSNGEQAPRQLLPDEIKINTQIEEQTKLIEQLTEKMTEMNKKISGTSSGKDEYQRERDLISEELNAIQTEIDALENRRKELMDTITNRTADAKKVRNAVVEARRKLPYATEAEVDERIAEINNQIETTTIPLKMEKELMAKLVELKALKPKIRAVQDLSQAAASQETTVDTSAVKYEVDQIRKKIESARDRRKVLYERRDRMTTKRATEVSSMRELYDARDSIRVQLADAQSKKAELRNELARLVEFHRQELARKRAVTEAARALEARKRHNEQMRKDLLQQLENVEEPAFVEDISEMQSLIRFLERLEKKGTVSNQTTEEPSATQLKCIADEQKPKDVKGVILLPKHLRNEEDAVSGKKKKGGNPKAAVPAAPKEEKFKLDVTSLSLLAKYKQAVPTKPEDCTPIASNIQKVLDAKLSEQKSRLENIQEQKNIILAKISAHDQRVAEENARLEQEAALQQ